MIINLKGKVNENEVKFDPIQVYFQQNCYVSVTQIYVQFSKKVNDVTGILSTSLIDKSPINPDQEIIFFNVPEKSRSILFTPTHLAQYKIQCQSLQDSVFEIKCLDSDENTVKIEKIRLQLKITNARI